MTSVPVPGVLLTPSEVAQVREVTPKTIARWARLIAVPRSAPLHLLHEPPPDDLP